MIVIIFLIGDVGGNIKEAMLSSLLDGSDDSDRTIMEDQSDMDASIEASVCTMSLYSNKHIRVRIANMAPFFPTGQRRRVMHLSEPTT
jgi:hypothetical protein